MKNIFPKIIPVLFLLLGVVNLFSQTSNPSAKTEVEEAGVALFEKAKDLAQKNLDSAELYLRLALPKFEKAENWKMYISALNLISVYQFLKGDHEAFNKSALDALNLAEKYLPKDSNESNDALSNLAISYSERGQFKKAIKIFETIYEREKKIKNIDRRGSTLNSLGYIFSKIGDQEESFRHYNQAIKIWRDTTGYLRYGNEARINNRIGNFYFENGKLDSAIAQYHIGIKNITHPEMNIEEIQDKVKTQLHLDLAKAYISKKDHRLALNQIESAQSLSKQTYFYNQGLINELLGRIYLDKSQTALAIKNFEKSKQVAKKEFDTYHKHPLIAEKDIWLGKSYLKIKDYQSALLHFHGALNGLSNDSLELDVSQNPELENLFAKKIALQALSQKAKTQFLIFQKEKNTDYLRQSYDSYFLAIQLIQNLRQDYLAEGSKQNLSSNALSTFEEAIEVAISCFEQTQDSIYLNQAFSFSEKNKANILLESIAENTAKGFAGIPSNLLDEEEDIRIEIAFYKKTINELQLKSGDNDEKIKALEKKLFKEQKKYRQLITTFEQDFPKYYQAKYSNKLASLKDIQNNFLKPKQVLIEYFLGEKNIYVFTVTPSQLKIHTLNNPQKIRSSILRIIELISNPPSNEKKDFQDFTQQSYFLFEQLIKNSLPEKINEVVIIPDDILNYLPFEVLLSKKNNNTVTDYSLSNLDYFFETCSINYSYSSTLLLNNLEKPKSKSINGFVGFAPSFDNPELSEKRSCNENNLSTLHCSKDEIKRIEKLFPGKKFSNKNANLKNFNDNAKTSNILHLATHACVDDKNPLFNKIHLSDDYISNNDLYNLSLNAELVVLSACNTGIGKLAKGEGVMSLSRGFIHAGSPSVVMSLWSVDDCATSDIMVDFYKNLKLGKAKNESLRQAKINFISDAKKAQQHPYYWAAFVQIGNNNSITLPPNNSFYLFLFLGFLLLSVFIFFFIKKKSPFIS